MPSGKSREDGFTLVELLAVMALFAVISVGFYQVLFASASGATTARSTASVSAEARLGLNRLVRDARESEYLDGASPTSYTIQIDFDGDGILEPTPDDPAGNYEIVTATWDPVARTVSLSNGVTSEVLIRDIDCIRKADGSCHDVFDYTSSRLEYDANGDGVTTATELDQSVFGNNNGVLDGQEPSFVDTVKYSFRVTKDGHSTNFYAEAQLRNFR